VFRAGLFVAPWNGLTAAAVEAGGEAGGGLLLSLMGRLGMGVGDTISWTLRQHSIQAMHASFKPRGDMPRSFRVVRRWPSASAGQSLLRHLAIGMVPFHPANDGLHTFMSPDAAMEARVAGTAGLEETKI